MPTKPYLAGRACITFCVYRKKSKYYCSSCGWGFAPGHPARLTSLCDVSSWRAGTPQSWPYWPISRGALGAPKGPQTSPTPPRMVAQRVKLNCQRQFSSLLGWFSPAKSRYNATSRRRPVVAYLLSPRKRCRWCDVLLLNNNKHFGKLPLTLKKFICFNKANIYF